MCDRVSANSVLSDFHEIRCRSYFVHSCVVRREFRADLLWQSFYLRVSKNCVCAFHNSWPISVKFGIGGLKLLPFNMRYFRESLSSDSLTVLKTVMTTAALFWAVTQLSSASRWKFEIRQIMFNLVRFLSNSNSTQYGRSQKCVRGVHELYAYFARLLFGSAHNAALPSSSAQWRLHFCYSHPVP